MVKKRITFFEYLITFLGFSAMYFFILPDTDVFLFSRDYENNISSIFNNALHYGNGRLLGNMIGFAFSMNFFYAFLVVSITLTAIVILMNSFFFNGNYKTVMPLALAIAFPCTGFLSEVYFAFPSFVNYVIPFVFVFASLCLIKSQKNKLISAFLIFVFSAASCLFSENTTVSIFTLSILAVVYYCICEKKLNILNFSFVAGTSVGGLVMILIPKLFETTSNIESYRSKADSISAVITSALAAFSMFADIFSRLFIPLIIISGVFILLIKKESRAPESLKTILCITLAFFPVEAFFYTMFSQYGPSSTYFFIFQAGLVILYAVALFIAILYLNNSVFKKLNICLYILTLSSFGPILLAYMYGWRTFYIPYIVLISYDIFLLKEAKIYVLEHVLNKVKDTKTSKSFAFVLSFCFLCLSFTVFIQSVYNYNFYVTRTQIISETVSEDDTKEIKVPVLPCRGISCEDESASIGWLMYKTNKKNNIVVAEKIYCDQSQRYSEILNSNPLSAAIAAVKSLEFKNDQYVFDLLSK